MLGVQAVELECGCNVPPLGAGVRAVPPAGGARGRRLLAGRAARVGAPPAVREAAHHPAAVAAPPHLSVQPQSR